MNKKKADELSSCQVPQIFIEPRLVESVNPEIVIKSPIEDEPASKRPRRDLGNVCIPDPAISNLSSSSSEEILQSSATESENESLSENELFDEMNSFITEIEIEEPLQHSNLYDFYDYGSDRLYPSSDFTVVQALAVLYDWFSSFPGISKEAFSKLLDLLHRFLLPRGNNLPDSYSKAFSIIKKFLVPVKDYHSCVNDCVVFRKCSKGDYSDLSICPDCNSERYEPNSTIARKTFKYIPIAFRLKRMFSDSTVSKLLQSHLASSTEEDSEVSDLHNSEAWRTSYSQEGQFCGDPRGIALSLCVDGMNPFSRERISYSMWPITLNVLNLPFAIRNRLSSMMLAGIIPGKSEPKNLNPYIEVLVDEIKELKGSVCYDAYREENFMLNVDIFMTVVDYPGFNKLFHCAGAGGYSGCGYCTIRGEHSSILQKMIYPCNRCFLPMDSPLRKDKSNFSSKKTDFSPPPDFKTMDYVDAAIEKYSTASTVQEKKEILKETGCKDYYSLKLLPSHDRLHQAPIDPMHLIKNISSHCISLIVGIEDSIKVRMEEESRRRFKSSWVSSSRKELPSSPFSLTKENIQLADERAMRVYVPLGFDWQPKKIFKHATGLKSHEWKLLSCCGILKFCLRGMLGGKQRSTLFMLFDVLTEVCREKLSSDTLDELEEKVHLVLALVERDFPVSMQFIVFHLLHHLPMFIKRYGPVYTFWMFQYERFNSWIKRRVNNRRYPEATVIQSYRLSEWTHFMELSEKFENGTFAYTIDVKNELPLCPTLPSCTSNFSLTGDVVELLFSSYGLCLDDCSSDLPLEAVQLYHYRYEDEFGRSVVLGCAEAEREHSHSRSSYVSHGVLSMSKHIGRIIYMFRHTFANATTTFAYLSWFDGPYNDKDSNLNFVFCDKQTQAVVPVKEISKPLVIAYDDEELNKLWILNLDD